MILSFLYFVWFFAPAIFGILGAITADIIVTPILIYLNIKLCRGAKDLCLILFLCDNILLGYIGGVVGLVGMTIQFMGPNAPFYMIIMVIVICLDTFLLSGPYRLALSRYKWKKYQVILAKIIIGTCSFAFLFNGAYFMSNDF